MANLNKRKRRRLEYAKTQFDFTHHQSRCIKTILQGGDNSSLPEADVMIPFWNQMMTETCSSSPGINTSLAQDLENIWSPITSTDINNFMPTMSSAPGPDGIKPVTLRTLGPTTLCFLYNLILWCGILPRTLRDAKTIFIPKNPSADTPGDFRPITIGSIFLRHLHAILADRIGSKIVLDKRQRAFIKADGCADNTTLIDLLLRQQHATYSSTYIASIDISKAFDSLSHTALFEL